MDTKANITEIECMLASHFDARKNMIIPNVSWGFFSTHEADLVVVKKCGYLTEVEIKRSWSDFKNDFKKTTTHDEGKVMLKYFAVPESILQKVLDFLEEKDPASKWGVIGYTDTAKVCYERSPSNFYKRNKDMKLTTEEQLSLARLGTMRIWSLKNKILNMKNNKHANSNDN